MDRLRNISIRSKKTLIIMLTTSIALFLACASFVVYELFSFRRGLVQDVSILAEVIGSNCAAALDFNDPQAATDTLSALRANRHIVSAAVYTPQGEIFAVYHRDEASRPVFAKARTEGHGFTGNQLNLFRPIETFGQVSGTIFVASDLNQLYSRLTQYVSIVGIVLIASLLLAFVLSRYVQRLVSSPILHLAQVVRTVAQERDYSVRARKTSEDELGQLMDGFNEMLNQIQLRDSALKEARDNLEKRVQERTHELEATHQQLVETSRLSGMAEIATNVLHNVGNVLNSVNISAGLVADRVRNSRVSALSKVVGLLRQHKEELGSFITEDPKGKNLPAYLEQLSELVRVDQAATLKELTSLSENIDHIKQIVAVQQSYAKTSGIKELVDVRSLVEDSVRMNTGSRSNGEIEVVREYDDVPPLNLEKNKIMQILVNLLRNAQHACKDSGRDDKRLTVQVKKADDGLDISVADNGVGIPSENLIRIFNHGFTTRPGGHGFGLHSSALAAKEMGGSLHVSSDGPGCGAVFTLKLPIPS